jgi:hypothetical protein
MEAVEDPPRHPRRTSFSLRSHRTTGRNWLARRLARDGRCLGDDPPDLSSLRCAQPGSIQGSPERRRPYALYVGLLFPVSWMANTRLGERKRRKLIPGVPEFEFLTNHGNALLLIMRQSQDPNPGDRRPAGHHRACCSASSPTCPRPDKEGHRNIYSIRTDLPLHLPFH